jgi:hypothetical protein
MEKKNTPDNDAVAVTPSGPPVVRPWRRILCWLVSDEASNLTAVLQLVVVTISLIFILCQLRQQTQSIEQQATSIKQQAAALDLQSQQMKQQVELTTAANTQALANMIIPMGIELAQNPELMELTLSGAKGFHSKVNRATVREAQYQSYLATFLIFYENTYSQDAMELLPKGIYAGWQNDLKNFVDEERLDKYWDTWKESYTEGFRKLVTAFVDEKRAKEKRAKRPGATK